MSSTEANVPMTMAFVVLSLASVFAGLVMRRDPESGLSAPVLGALKILSIPAIITVLAVELGFLQAFLMTTSLTGGQWLACLGLAVIVPVVVELEKIVRRRRKAGRAEPIPAPDAVLPQRARA